MKKITLFTTQKVSLVITVLITSAVGFSAGAENQIDFSDFTQRVEQAAPEVKKSLIDTCVMRSVFTKAERVFNREDIPKLSKNKGCQALAQILIRPNKAIKLLNDDNLNTRQNRETIVNYCHSEPKATLYYNPLNNTFTQTETPQTVALNPSGNPDWLKQHCRIIRDQVLRDAKFAALIEIAKLIGQVQSKTPIQFDKSQQPGEVAPEIVVNPATPNVALGAKTKAQDVKQLGKTPSQLPNLQEGFQTR